MDCHNLDREFDPKMSIFEWENYVILIKVRTETAEWLDPSSDLAFSGIVGTQLTPIADLHVMGRFNDVGDIVARVDLAKI